MFRAEILVKQLKKLIKTNKYLEAIEVYKELGKVLDTYKDAC